MFEVERDVDGEGGMGESVYCCWRLEGGHGWYKSRTEGGRER